MADESSLDYQLVRALQEQSAAELTVQRQKRQQEGKPALGAADERQLMLSIIRQKVSEHMQAIASRGQTPPPTSYDQRLISAVDAAIYGAGELQELLDDPQVENIDINGCDEVWVTYADERGQVRGRAVAASDADLIEIIQNLAAMATHNPRPFTPANPTLDLRLPDGSRMAAGMATAERPFVSIRKNRFPQMFMSKLVELGTLDDNLAEFLTAAIAAKMNIIVAGGTDAGKTTLLRGLINTIDPRERIITVERAIELGLRRHPELHPNVLEWEEVQADSEGRGGLSIQQLVLRTRRHNPDRVIVGEVLGPEVVEMLSAMSQGNNGSLSTLHARSAHDVFQKLCTYGAQHESLDWSVTSSLISSAVDFVVYIEKNRKLGGRRCVTEVIEVSPDAKGRQTPDSASVFVPSPVDGRAMRAVDVALIRSAELADAGFHDSQGWGG